MPVRSRDAATRDRNGFVSVSMAPAGRDAACEDPHPDGGQRDRQPEREVAPEVPGRSPVDPLGQERALDAERLEGGQLSRSSPERGELAGPSIGCDKAQDHRVAGPTRRSVPWEHLL